MSDATRRRAAASRAGAEVLRDTADRGVTEEPPPTGGVFLRWSGPFRRWGGLSFPVIEELYGPSRHQARVEVEEQRRAGQPSPAPTDLPLPEPGPAAPGRSRARSTGIVVVHRRP